LFSSVYFLFLFYLIETDLLGFGNLVGLGLLDKIIIQVVCLKIILIISISSVETGILCILNKYTISFF